METDRTHDPFSKSIGMKVRFDSTVIGQKHGLLTGNHPRQRPHSSMEHPPRSFPVAVATRRGGKGEDDLMTGSQSDKPSRPPAGPSGRAGRGWGRNFNDPGRDPLKASNPTRLGLARLTLALPFPSLPFPLHCFAFSPVSP